jgi:hypothetical protein
MGVSGQRHAPTALLHPGKGPSGTHWTGGWVGPRDGLDTEATGKISCLCRGLKLDRPVVQPVARHYTDWANPVSTVISTGLKTFGSHMHTHSGGSHVLCNGIKTVICRKRCIHKRRETLIQFLEIHLSGLWGANQTRRCKRNRYTYIVTYMRFP